jgi:hypothetical protein
MRNLNFDAPAMLEKSIVRRVRHGEFQVLCHRQAYRGTLLRCLHQYELKPVAQKFLYSILVSEKTRIEWREIDEIIAQAQDTLPLALSR